MRDKMMKMLAKKRDLSPNEKHAKMSVVKDLKDSVSGMMGDKLDGLGKVSVMSNSKQGLQHGLDKAKGILNDPEEQQMQQDAEAPYSDFKHAEQEHEHEHGGNEMGMAEGGEVEESPDQGDYEAADEGSPAQEDEESPEHEGEESSEEESEEDHENLEGLDIDEIQKRIDHLMELHKKLSSK